MVKIIPEIQTECDNNNEDEDNCLNIKTMHNGYTSSMLARQIILISYIVSSAVCPQNNGQRPSPSFPY